MDWDRQREAGKRAELLKALVEALQECGATESEASVLGQSIFNKYISTMPPEAASHVTELVVLGRMGEGGAKSTKAGNIKLNIGKLFEAVASGVLTAVGAIQLPVTAPFAALVIWCSLWRTAQVTISETDASVLYSMWMHKNADRDVPDEGLLERCNTLLIKYGRPLLSQQMLLRSLKTLEQIDTIERSPRSTTSWWLREWVRLSYR